MKTIGIIVIILISSVVLGLIMAPEYGSIKYGGDSSATDNYVDSPTDTRELSFVDYLNITSSRGYTDDMGWTHIVFSIENNGDRDIEMLQVQIAVLDENRNILSSKTLYPSDYPNYGLPAGESFSYETLFRPEESYGFGRYSIKVVNGRWA